MSPSPTTHPVARIDGARVVVDGHHLHWQPWAPPVLLDERADAIRRALDGAPLIDLVHALAEVEHRPVAHVQTELDRTLRHLARHGLIEGAPAWTWWSPAALHRPLTACDAQAWDLDRAEVFDLEVAGRRITVVIGDPTVAAELRGSARFAVLDPPADLGLAPVEAVLAPADGPRGVHRLLGRAGRTFARSTDRGVVVRAFFDHLAALEHLLIAEPDQPDQPDQPDHPDQTAAPDGADRTGAPGQPDRTGEPRPAPGTVDPTPVWFDATALVLPDGGVALLAGRARYDWARLARPLAGLGIHALPGPAVAVDPVSLAVVPPQSPDPDLEELARRCGAAPSAGRTGPHLRTGPDTTGGAGPDQAHTVRRIDHVANDAELAQLRTHGHDPEALTPALAAHRLALLAHTAALDRFPHQPPGTGPAHHILATAAAVATAPGVRSSLHVRTADLVSSLRGLTPGRTRGAATGGTA